MNQEVLKVCEAVRAAGGRAFLVGGWVRDFLAGIDSKDYDVEVYGVGPAQLRSLLEQIARVNTVGESFTVYKLAFANARGQETTPARFEIDVSIPRRESKSGRGHRGFVVEGDPAMSVEEAARRRDFTVNAILYDPLTNETIDPYGGAEDLRRRLLKAVSAETFVEDSLRVLRAMQLAARFEMTIDPQTAALCRSIDLSDLPHERIWGEFEKLLTRAERPSIGLDAALELGILEKLFPAIRALCGCAQDAAVYPEGDVFAHTKRCLDEAAKHARGLPVEKRITLLLAALCHDLGKPVTAMLSDGKPAFPGHDEAGVKPAVAVLDRLGLHSIGGYDVRARVIELVREHLRPGELYRDREQVTDGAIRRLSHRVDIGLLCLLASADGSPAAADWLIEKARELGVEEGPPEAILMGRHLLEAGFPPGPLMGEVLREVYELQLDGAVTSLEEALAAARQVAATK